MNSLDEMQSEVAMLESYIKALEGQVEDLKEDVRELTEESAILSGIIDEMEQEAIRNGNS